ncbi:HET-domain-containing protein [Karstenula rhodostoma CBS 690.94]|uniref:HET-domain-containing protein n=1 Tax=Karstenula rhodostoma CBS 690.94 TaxID=1392251 RepID=A0A9P4PHT2_9PLEO|nr:HET-domain-containing protein [Karstenula rhodostoma CBS 690.94]
MANSVEEQPGLCSRCKTLDIAGVRSSTHPRLPLGPIKDWHPDTCNFCGFLVNLLSRNPSIQPRDEQPYFLFSIKTRSAPDKLFQILDHRLIVLSTAESGPPPESVPYLAAHIGEPPRWLKYVQPSIDFERAKEWLRVCTELHGDNCSGGKGYVIQNFRLIDCSTGAVVQARSDEPYVALSYVWGEEEPSTQGAHAYPKTIRDAIVATRNLGHRWLWVDKYCIHQNDTNDLNDQLQQMDIIYQQAAVTIIAAAGTNAHYGLPGVDQSYRKPTSSVLIGDERVCAIPKPELHPSHCRWISRAWTYQEGLLSTRRLVFTDDQLHFECQGGYSAEMLSIPVSSFKKMHAPSKPYLHKRYRAAGRMGLFPLNGCGVDPWDIYPRITEYSARRLSHPSDILNGVLGIFRAFEKMINPMCHVHGIPFAKTTPAPGGTSLMTTNSKRALPCFAESLRWDLHAPSLRREGFPSWSWTGWYGSVTWPGEYTDVDVVRTARRIERPRDPSVNEGALGISFLLTDGGAMSWGDMQGRYEWLLTHKEPSIFLDVEAHVTRASYCPGEGQIQMFCLPLGEGTCVVSASMTTAGELRAGDEFLAIHFHRTARGNQGRSGMSGAAAVTQHLLIIQQMGGYWERVAVASYVIDPENKVLSTWQRIRLG